MLLLWRGFGLNVGAGFNGGVPAPLNPVIDIFRVRKARTLSPTAGTLMACRQLTSEKTKQIFKKERSTVPTLHPDMFKIGSIYLQKECDAS